MTIIAMNTAITGAQAQELRIAAIANNVSNVNTVAYKKTDVAFSDLYYANLKKAGILENAEAAPRPTGVQIGMGTKALGTYRIMKQGEFKQTFHPLDIAISGAGYFSITVPSGNGKAYTRAGTFQRDPVTGNIVTPDGNPVDGAPNLPNNISLDQIQISDSGAITNTTGGVSTPLGQLQLYTFPNEAGLEAQGNNLLIETPGSGAPIAVAIADMTKSFKQGYLEESNVSAVTELTNLIAAQRGHELNMRVISTVDKIMESINNIK